MQIVPEFLIKKIYQKGSLKKLDSGVSLTLKNVLGPGFISGFNYVKINNFVFESKDVKFITNGKEYTADDVSETNPIAFRLSQSGTLIMQGNSYCVIIGKNTILIEALNPEAGIVQLNVEDTV